MSRRIPIWLLGWAAAAMLGAQSVPDLFQKAKEEVKASSWHDALVTMEVLETAAAKPENEKYRSQLEAPLAFYRGVCEANVDQADKASADFETFLRLQPNASIDEKMYSKKAVAAFEGARKAMAGEGPSLARAYQNFRPPAAKNEPVTSAWGDGPVVWLMTDGEKVGWSNLTNDEERTAFVEKFWVARDAEDDHTFRPTFEKRVAFADANFTQNDKGEKRGSMTDRGMVFVLMGPPTYGGRRRLKQGEDANENRGMSTVNPTVATIEQTRLRGTGAGSAAQNVLASTIYTPGTQAPESSLDFQEAWHYRKELLPKGVGYLQVDAVFITKKGYGMWVLQRDSDILTTMSAAKAKPE